ncbi:Cthe_2314 family HEPN domain-containing protein [Paenibacillus dokdonensis]|uniref:Cthe_2314 family HEPN domain-containing protein n=1 Tax=Paenibacillus dokdonensis TaxID=2567944 RepID=A0ABU6GUH9_9BACL|nr:Cthe_2314 family HEPN domain-containing protein [Paenibacillus dokdonensis]MEC0241807.1 Cthe_2314 family HEPN domain-containing protein [Paenibacillus dokdonensis]
MLRTMLGEMPRQNNGLLEEAIETMFQTIQVLQREMEKNDDPSHDFRKLEIWTRGLVSSLDELEQSYYAACFFRKSVKAGFVDDMNIQEQSEYARYVYFYKNGFIRVFSILDKLGTVLNDMFDLHTSKVKAHYSYFTVLRQFDYLKNHQKLAEALIGIKNDYRSSLNVLRKRRNAEIHYMNAEMQDDLWQRHQVLHDKVELEDLDKHLDDLKQGLDMICKSLIAAYKYANELWAKKGMQV